MIINQFFQLLLRNHICINVFKSVFLKTYNSVLDDGHGWVVLIVVFDVVAAQPLIQLQIDILWLIQLKYER